ncbi:MAG: ABC transporter permease, partial [Burkholderiaceae bacterium]
MRLLNLAWRNTLRNPRRTALTLVAFSVGVAALVFAWSVFDGSNAQMINNMTGNYTGYIQIHSRGYTDDPSVDRAFNVQDFSALKFNEIPGIAAVSPRIETLALISSAENSRGLILIGVDPVQEPSVTALHKKISAGRYFAEGEKGGILLGKSLAKVLGVGIGGEVAVLTQGMQGSIGAQRYKVRGLYDTQNDMVDSMQAFISMADAEELLSSQGQMTTIAIKLDDRDKTDAVVQKIGAQLGDKFEVEGWKQLLPEVAQSVDFHESVGKVITLILFGIVAIGVANTVLMSVMERLREFGVMMAVGTSSKQVFRIIIYEGLILGLLGFAIGLAIGYALVSYFGSVGLALTRQDQSVQLMQGVARAIYPHLSVDRMLYISTAVLTVIVTASLYPAWKIARMVPLHAMQGVTLGSKSPLPAASAHAASISRFLLSTLAMRNLTRHPLRTLLTMIAITFGLGAFVFVGSIANGFYTQIVANATGMVTGDAQIQHKDFKNDMKP